MKNQIAAAYQKSIISTFPVAMLFTLNNDGIFIDYQGTDNSELLMPPEAFLNKHFTEIMPPEVAAMIDENFRRVINGNEKSVFEYSMETPAGLQHYEAILTRAGDYGVIAIVKNITVHKYNEEHLKETNRKLVTLISNLPGMMYKCRNDNDWTFEFVTEGCEELTGYTKEDWIENKNISFTEIVLPEYLEEIRERERYHIARREKFQHEYRIRCKDGTIKWLWEQGQGVLNDNGEPVSLEGIIMDITESKLKEEKIVLQNKALQEIAFNQSHVVRAPIATIKGILALIRPESLDAETRKLVGLLIPLAEKLDEVIRENVKKSWEVRST